MSWGEPSAQPPYDPNNPYGQQPFPQQPQQPQPPQVPQGPQGPQPGWAQPSGAGYTQPMPDPSGYGQQPQYPYESQGGFPQQQPGYPQPGYPQPEYTPYPPPAKKGNGALIATVVAAVLVVGGGITAAVMLTGKSNNPSPVADNSSQSSLVSPSAGTGASQSAAASSSATPDSGSSSSLTVPTSVSGLTLLTDSAATSAVSKMRESLTSDSELYPDPVVGAYNDSSGNNVTTLFENQAIADLSSSTQDQLTGYDASTIVSQLMSGAGVSNAQSETTTASDGALSCGSRAVSSINVVFCFWDDTTSFGGLEYYDSPSLSDAAAAADAIRAASEGGS